MSNLSATLKIPNGHPFVLFQIRAGNRKKYVAAATDEQALRIACCGGGAVAEPVTVNELVSSNGHNQTHKLLASVGPTWVCRENYVFYKQKSNNV